MLCTISSGPACRSEAATRRALWREARRSVLLGLAIAAALLAACLLFLRAMPPLKVTQVSLLWWCRL